MLTPTAQSRVWSRFLPELDGGQLEVSSGGESARAPIESVVEHDGILTLSATFSEDEANFEWLNRAVIASDGTVMDVEPEDNGRKVAGAVWTLEVDLKWRSGQ